MTLERELLNAASMSRLNRKFPRKETVKFTRAIRYLNEIKHQRPRVFRYFYELDIFQPPTFVRKEEIASVFYICEATAVKMIKIIQKEYNRLPFNFVTLEDLSNYSKIEMSEFSKYFFYRKAGEFYKRTKNLNHK